MTVEQIIHSGDRVELKKWLKECTDADLRDHWVKLAVCKVQDFAELTDTEMRRRFA